MKKKIYIASTAIVLLVLLQLTISFFFVKGAPDYSSQFDYKLPYHLEAPDKEFELKHKLNEISGLSMLDKKHVLAIQDEEGAVYSIHTKKGEIKDKFKYTKSGDFEGIAVVKDKVYTLRSDGKIYEILNLGKKKEQTISFKTPLNHKNDTEGLCYDPLAQRLLIACKEFPGDGKALKQTRAIYAFDLALKELSKDPVYTINLKEIRDIANDKKKEFKPSGIAVHPITNDIYLIASVGNMLVILDRNGQLKLMAHLPTKLFKQPEGITFLPNGDMLISNEARIKGSRSTILKFKFKEEK